MSDRRPETPKLRSEPHRQVQRDAKSLHKSRKSQAISEKSLAGSKKTRAMAGKTLAFSAASHVNFSISLLMPGKLLPMSGNSLAFSAASHVFFSISLLMLGKLLPMSGNSLAFSAASHVFFSKPQPTAGRTPGVARSGRAGTPAALPRERAWVLEPFLSARLGPHRPTFFDAVGSAIQA